MTRPTLTHRRPPQRSGIAACCGPQCHDRLDLPGGGWECRSALERGLLWDPHPAPVTEPASPPRHHEHRAVAVIEARQCPCCGGSLGAAEREGWLVCCGDDGCGCWHRVDVIGGRPYACVFRPGQCRGQEAAR